MAAVLREAPAAHVLVVDDDLAVRQLVSEYLAQNDFRVSAAASGAELMGAFRAQVVDLVLLDLRLQGEDGMQLLQQLRAESQLPVIILTGRTEEADRVMGLELGADDYVTKPFSLRELVARIKVGLRRQTGRRKSPLHRLGNIEIDLPSHRVTKNGAELSLTKKEYEILELLLSRPGEVITRDEFLNQLWGEDVYVTHRVIDTHMASLRKKLEDDPNNPEHILSVRGVGYRLDVNSSES